MFADNPDIDGDNGSRPGECNNVLHQAGADAAMAMCRQNEKAMHIGETGLRSLESDARDAGRGLFGDEVTLTASKIGLNPIIGAKRRMLWAVAGMETEFYRNVLVGFADEPCQSGTIF